ncbi:hypothetical protein [Mycobacterium uberis]|uniref:hypothetical protein n=1 Tax=Mycobacterium uberis TaxID=2162698 RepID=UPI000E30A54C|nr:hypothetical protein [Mycobacterium uberis]
MKANELHRFWSFMPTPGRQHRRVAGAGGDIADVGQALQVEWFEQSGGRRSDRGISLRPVVSSLCQVSAASIAVPG